MRKGAGLGLAAVAWLCLLPAIADAASCSALRADLARLQQGTPAAGGKWQTAHSQQQKAIEAAERDARYFRCDTMGNSPKCVGLNSKIDRMRRNLRAIERKLGGSSPSKAQIRRVQQRLDAQNCNQPDQTARAEKASSPSGLLAKIFDAPKAGQAPAGDPQYRTLPNGLVVRTSRNDLILARSREGNLNEVRSRASLTGDRNPKRVRIPSGGTFRTLCVRTCDGYFFPLSFSTGKNQFADDAARCGEICPASQTELFVHRNPGGVQDDMVSLAGIPYSEMENAYRFKTEFVENCSCRQSREAAKQSRMTPIARSGDGFAGGDGRIRVALYPDAPAPFFAAEDDPEIASPWRRDPLLPDQLPAGLDPSSRQDMEGGFNAAIRLSALANAEPLVSEPGATASAKSLPVLGARQSEAGAASNANATDEVIEPVFSSMDSTISRPAPTGPIRVVGPEYFVAQ